MSASVRSEPATSKPAQTAPLLIELGCEEIPAGVAPAMARSLADALAQTLEQAGLTHGTVTTLGTPRRLAVHIADVLTRQPDRSEELTGPPAKVAFQSCGTATKAGEGFARGQGMTAADLYTVTTPKGDYAALRKETPGQLTVELLGGALPGILRALPQPKKMRWDAAIEAYIRPVRWLVALLGHAVMSCEFAGVTAGANSRGHRFTHDTDIAVTATLDGYKGALRAAGVMVDANERQAAIVAGAEQVADGRLVQDAETLAVVTWLVEWPWPLVGTFDDDFLAIPDEVILTTLKSHQKLFCVRGDDGALLPRFVAVANTLSDASRAMVAQGNAKVVSARLSDARFFYIEDGKQPLADYTPRLDRRIWLQGLGTVLDKARRIQRLAIAVGKRVGAANMSAVERSAWLCKADLETRMVGEFPGLQGTIGADYARRSGESDAVAVAIAEHYLPRFAGDALPATEPGAIVALADRLDTIVGCFGIGLVPTGTQDPYALRRAALGALHLLAVRGWDVGLAELLAMARGGYRKEDLKADGAELDSQLLDFMRGRLRSLHQASYPTDIVDAVLHAGFDRVATVLPRLVALAKLRTTDAFEPLAITFKRVGNIVRKATEDDDVGALGGVDGGLFVEDAEHALLAAVTDVSGRLRTAVEKGHYDQAIGHLSSLRPTVDRFFDDVMVMDDDPAVRRNRLALMQLCGQQFAAMADFTRIQGRR